MFRRFEFNNSFENRAAVAASVFSGIIVRTQIYINIAHITSHPPISSHLVGATCIHYVGIVI